MRELHEVRVSLNDVMPNDDNTGYAYSIVYGNSPYFKSYEELMDWIYDNMHKRVVSRCMTSMNIEGAYSLKVTKSLVNMISRAILGNNGLLYYVSPGQIIDEQVYITRVFHIERVSA